MVALTFISYLTALSVLPSFIQADHLSLNRRAHHLKRALPGGWHDEGCYTDDPYSRTLTGALHVIEANTVESCIKYCNQHKFFIAGVEYGTECYCGNYLSNGIPAPLPECSTPCPGNPKTTCGAGSRIHLYAMDGKPPDPPSVGSWNQAGCFTDSQEGRTLTVGPLIDDSMTVEKCNDHCKKLGYTLSGLEYGHECWCSNQLDGNTWQMPDSECHMPCGGDGHRKCGSADRLSLYRLVQPPKEHGWNNLGCFRDENGARTFSVVSDGKTPEECQKSCANNGYQIAATEFGHECYCDNQFRNGGIKMLDRDCDMPCEGGDPNTEEICGGRDRLSVYYNFGDSDDGGC